MNVTERESAAAVTDAYTPECQSLLQCAERCCPPVRCTRPAVARVSFACDTTGCEHVSHCLLLCAACAEQAAANTPAPTARPL